MRCVFDGYSQSFSSACAFHRARPDAARAGPTACASSPIGAPRSSRSKPPADKGRDAPGGPREGFDFQNLHRNKRSLTLNLKTKDGRGDLHEAGEKADVIVENFRSEVKLRLGSITRTSRRSTRASSTAASPASARTGRTPSGRGSTRSPRAWAG